MNRLFITLLASAFIFAGCAQVPQSSVTLSNSIANDLTSMQVAHKKFINFYYDSLEQKANDLIDKQYRPSLIRQLIDLDVARFKNPAKKNRSLFNAIQVAFVDNAGLSSNELETAQSNALAGMQIFFSKIDQKVEAKRNDLLDPLKQQRVSFLEKIDANYLNIIKKNAAVTALLTSIVDVQESQQELLSLADIDTNIREEVGNKLSDLVDQVDAVQDTVNNRSTQVKDIENTINEFKKIISQ